MRLALISDIHGNRIALERVLADLRGTGADRIVCLGDLAAHGPEPRETLDLVRTLDASLVMGNADAGVYDIPEGPPGDKDWVRIGHLYKWCAAQLDEEHIAFLKSLPRSVQYGDLYCCHGSPRSFGEAITATTPDEELGRMLEGVHAEMIAAGHTHLALLRRYGTRTVLNPGSVGIPMWIDPQTGDQKLTRYAEYAIVSEQRGGFAVEFRRVEFDPAAVREAGRRANLPHLEWWLNWWRF
jgi:putative phosphoesterase